MAQVRLIVSAPTTRLRSTGRTGEAPPIREVITPVTASATSTAAQVTPIRQPIGASSIASNGSNAPNEKDSIDAQAACHGLLR